MSKQLASHCLMLSVGDQQILGLSCRHMNITEAFTLRSLNKNSHHRDAIERKSFAVLQSLILLSHQPRFSSDWDNFAITFSDNNVMSYCFQQKVHITWLFPALRITFLSMLLGAWLANLSSSSKCYLKELTWTVIWHPLVWLLSYILTL